MIFVNSEREQMLPVTVRKMGTIANNVSVRIQPLTIGQAMEMNLDLPTLENVDITRNNPSSPIWARSKPDSYIPYSG